MDDLQNFKERFLIGPTKVRQIHHRFHPTAFLLVKNPFEIALMNEYKLIVEPIIVEGNHWEMNVLHIVDVDGGVLEYIHTSEIVDIKVGNIRIIRN